MKWQDMRRSDNVEDRRGQSMSPMGGGGGFSRGGGSGMLIPLLLRLLTSRGKGKWLIILLLLFFVFSGGAGLLTNQNGGVITNDNGITMEDTTQKAEQGQQVTDEEGNFLSSVLASTEDFWSQRFAEHGLRYVEPKLVLYTEGTMTGGCGFGQSSAGPFYCPGDQKVYIDLDFYRELGRKYKAPGDFAMAYVLAHEIGHHVQNQLGTMEDYQALIQRNPSKKNEMTVRLELQADYYAGAWASFAQEQGVVEEGDFDEALQAANAVGDDTLQKENYGYVVPDSFTHGTSEQRQTWFARGVKYKGDFKQGDTFNQSID